MKRGSAGPWLVIAALFLTAAFPLFLLPVNFDVSWLFYMAGRVLHGVEPYRGVVEPNPPLIVWLNLPIQWASIVSGVPGTIAIKVAALLLVAASIAVSYRTLSRLENPPAAPLWFGAVLAFALLSVVDHHVFQREHIFLALVVPYACLLSVRMEGESVPTAWAALVGVLAAIGFWLKPFYLPIWAALEVVVAVRRGWRRIARPESVTVAAFGALYIVSIVLWAPAYVRIARWGATVYRTYGTEIELGGILLDPRAIASYFLVAFAIVLRRRYPVSGLRLALLTLLAGYIAAVVAQGKSFPNHWYPVEGTLVLAGYATLADVWRVRAPTTVDASGARRLARAAAIALVALGALNAFNTLARWRAAYQTDPFYLDGMRAVLTEGGGAESFFMIGGTMRSSFPLALVTGVPYVSRFHSLWLLQGSYPGDCHDPCRPFRYHRPLEMAPPERYEFDAMIDDLARTRPDVVFVDLVPPLGMAGFDYREYFSQSPAFRAAFGAYRFETTVGGRYRAYRRAR